MHTKDFLAEKAGGMFLTYHNRYDIPNVFLPEFIAVKYDLKPVMRRFYDGGQYPHIKRVCERNGLISGFLEINDEIKKYFLPPKLLQNSPKRDEEFFRGEIILYISKSRELIEKAKKYEIKDPRRYGELLGYPKCCIDFCEVESNNTGLDYPIKAYKNTKGMGSFLLNNLLWHLSDCYAYPYYLISHYPCSYNCKASKRYAADLLKLIEEDDALLALKLQEYLKYPILLWNDSHVPPQQWDENKGIVFEGNFKDNQVNYTDLCPLFRGGPMEHIQKFREGNKVEVTKKNIKIFLDDKLLYTLRKENEFDDGILIKFK